MFGLFRLWTGAITRLFASRKTLLFENLALRQQLVVLKRKNKRPRLNALDRFFWIAIQRFWAGWQDCLLIVTPATVADTQTSIIARADHEEGTLISRTACHASDGTESRCACLPESVEANGAAHNRFDQPSYS